MRESHRAAAVAAVILADKSASIGQKGNGLVQKPTFERFRRRGSLVDVAQAVGEALLHPPVERAGARGVRRESVEIGHVATSIDRRFAARPSARPAGSRRNPNDRPMPRQRR